MCQHVAHLTPAEKDSKVCHMRVELAAAQCQLHHVIMATEVQNIRLALTQDSSSLWNDLVHTLGGRGGGREWHGMPLEGGIAHSPNRSSFPIQTSSYSFCYFRLRILKRRRGYLMISKLNFYNNVLFV